MKTSVPGYPRIGKHRELKFATEKYFCGDICAAELEETARRIRLSNWKTLSESGITNIPSNDFSFYDSMLDIAMLFGVVPDDFRRAQLSPLDTLFALARGRQTKDGTDLRALPMRKWFNTNYHYIVSEISDTTCFVLSGSKPVDEFREALAQGIRTRPVLIAPFTFLKLSTVTAKKKLEDIASELVEAYLSLFKALREAGAEWITLDESALATDLSTEDIKLFSFLHEKIFQGKGSLKIQLQISHGDIRDCAQTVFALPFDGIALDFLEGKRNLAILREHRMCENTILTAGIVNGKNIWKNDKKRTLSLLAEIAEASGCTAANGRLEIGTSSSLLHVPLSLESETALIKNCGNRFAFAEEKLVELCEIATSFSALGKSEVGILAKEAGQIATQMEQKKNAQNSLSRPSDTRHPKRGERKIIQRDYFKFRAFPTTTIGSFPQTAAVRKNRAAFRHGEISQKQYEDTIRELSAQCIREQEQLGLDVLVHGEFERNDMVEFFGQNLEGFSFSANGWVQSYGSRCVKPPIIVSDVHRSKPITVKLARYVQSLTNKPVKGMLTGPVTILNWSFPREDIPSRESAFQIALAIREEVLDLERAGISIIQIDEAALKEKIPLRFAERNSEYLDWAISAFRLTHSGVQGKTQIHTHMCYSDFSDIIMEIEAMDADVITFEAARSNLTLLEHLSRAGFETDVGPGVYDIHSPRVPKAEELDASIETMRATLGRSKETYDGLWVNPDCGLKTRGVFETHESLRAMVAAAQRARV